MKRCLDLFSGAAGGWTLGVHRAGWRTVAACEADLWRRAVFSANWPDVEMFDDVRTLTADKLAHLGRIDAIIGSPPCQDASTANSRGRGVDGERTGLFFEYVRLVRELRPRWALAENVPGIRARGVDRVLAEMEAAGYTGWPLVVGAWHAGAPHRRNRVWFIWRRNDTDAEGERCGSGAARRSGAGAAGQPEQALHHADAPPVLGPALAGRQPDGVGAGATPDPRGDGVRQQPGRRGWPDGTGAAEPAGDAAADSARHDSRSGCGPGEPFAGPEGVSRDADQARLAERQGERGDARAEQPPALGASLLAWDHWNDGAPDLGRVDDGVSAALAARRGLGRACLAAYGDAVVPAITEQIARAIDAWDAREADDPAGLFG